MNKSEKLNKIFNNKLMKRFIPLVNPIVTYLNNGSSVSTQYDCSNEAWIHTENGVVISIDKNPCWNISYKRMEKVVRAICCKNYLPKKGDVVVDLGAGVGFETVLFQKLVGEDGMVFAIEAHPKTAFLLLLLCKKNGYKNVTVSQTAIGGTSGIAYIEDRSHHAGNSIKQNQKNGIKVSLMTFDQYIFEKNIKRINYMKINIEGAEEDAIEGMNESIKIIENIAISCHDFLEVNSNQRIKNKIVSFLLKNDFEVEESADEHYIRRSWVEAKNRKLK